MDDKIQILIADDHRIITEGLEQIIERSQDMHVVAVAENGKEAVALFSQHRPQIVLMDLNMPVMGGVEAIAAICKEFPGARVLVLTIFEEEEDVYRAVQAGAKGYVLKGVAPELLLDAIRTVHAGQTYLPGPITAKLTEHIRYPALTAREMEVLHLLKEGLSNQQIAQALFIVEGTVKSHVNSILEKLGVNDRTQAVVTALRRGLLRLN